MASFDINDFLNRAYEGNDIPYPSQLIFEPTYRCNMRCKMCFYSHEHFARSEEMTIDQIATCVSKLPSAIRRIVLIGGEPLCHPAILDIVKLFAVRKIWVSIATNGYFLKPELVDQLNDLDYVDKIVISFDGPPEVHNQIRGPRNSFERSFANILYASQYFPIEVVSVFQDGNESELIKLIPYLKQLKNCFFSVEIAREYPRESLEMTASRFDCKIGDLHMKPDSGMRSSINIETITCMLQDFRKKILLSGINFHFIPPNAIAMLPNLLSKTLQPPDKTFICQRLLKARLDPQGNLIHCYALRMSQGSLLEKSFDEIWNGNTYKQFRQNLLQKGLPPICNYCFSCQPSKSMFVAAEQKNLRLGIVGCGKISGSYIKAMKDISECSLIGVSSRSTERGEHFAKEYGTKIFSLPELVKQVDALVLATEPESHLPLLQKISKYGTCHILIEKPLAVSLQDCRQIISLSKQFPDVTWGVSSQTRHSPLIVLIKDLLSTARIGIPLYFSIQSNYNRQEGYYSQGNGWRRTIGGNVIFNQGTHMFDFLWDTFGLPKTISCSGSKVRHHDVPFDTVTIFLRYKNGLYGDLSLTTAASADEPLLRFRIIGTEGEIFVSTVGTKYIVKRIKSQWDIPAELRGPIPLWSRIIRRVDINSKRVTRHILKTVKSHRALSASLIDQEPLWTKVIRKVGFEWFQQPTEQWMKWGIPIAVHDLRPQIKEFLEVSRGVGKYSVSLEDGFQVVIMATAAQKSLMEKREVKLQEIIECQLSPKK